MGEFPSGQRGQTVNLLSLTSLVRIQLPPPRKALVRKDKSFSVIFALRRVLLLRSDIREMCERYSHILRVIFASRVLRGEYNITVSAANNITLTLVAI